MNVECSMFKLLHLKLRLNLHITFSPLMGAPQPAPQALRHTKIDLFDFFVYGQAIKSCYDFIPKAVK